MKIPQLVDIHELNMPLDVFSMLKKETSESNREEPLYVCDLSDVVNKLKVWRAKMPRVTPFYAVKCNDSTYILQVLASLGIGFDCASKGEISKVLDLDVDPTRIIFANPTKPASHIKYAAANAVSTMTFDSELELPKIKKNCPNAQLVLRIRCDARHAQCPLGEKFGCNAVTEGPKLLTVAKNLGLNVIGISFHVGSGCMDYPVYERAIRSAKALFEYGKAIGYDFSLLDIGGGFPGDKGKVIDEVADIVNGALEKYFPDNSVQVIAEPGRYFVASAYTLACRIHSKKETYKDGGLENVQYFINDGVYGSFNCNLYDHQVVVPQPLDKHTQSKLIPSSIWGPTCDALDKVCERVMLPNLDVDDVLVFENMGAYTVPIASPFNGFPLPIVHYCIQEEHSCLL